MSKEGLRERLQEFGSADAGACVHRQFQIRDFLVDFFHELCGHKLGVTHVDAALLHCCSGWWTAAPSYCSALALSAAVMYNVLTVRAW